jgi:hypothetical protein
VDVGIDPEVRPAGWTPDLAVPNDELRDVFAQILERLSVQQTYPTRGDDEQLARLLEGALLVPEIERRETLALRARRDLLHQDAAQPATRQDSQALQGEIAEIDTVLATREAEQLSKLDGLAEYLMVSDPQIQEVITRRIGDRVEIWAEVEVSTTEWIPTKDVPIEVPIRTEIKVATYDLATERLTTRTPQGEGHRDEASFHAFMLGLGPGGFSDNNSWTATAGRVVGGLHPIGDARDIAAAIVHVREGREGAWSELLLSVVGLIPLLGDLAKAGGRSVNATDEVLTALTKETDLLLDAEQTLMKAVAKSADDALADVVGKELSPASVMMAEAVEALSGPQKLLSSFAGRLVNENGALEDIFRRIAPGVLNNVDRRAAAAELRHLLEQLSDPEVQVQAIRSTNKARSPDMLVKYNDGTSKVIEVTAATFAPAHRKGKVILHSELASKTAERADEFQQAIEAGITRKLDTPKHDSQLRYQLDGVARPGELVVDTLVFNSRARELAEEAVAKLESRLADADYLGRIQINYLTRSVDDKLIHESVAFVRKNGRYVLSK